MPDRVVSFEQLVLPHLPAGYNLARWLLRNDHDAEDVMQEAVVRAFRFFDGFSGTNPRAWLLTVVRNSAYTFLRQNRACELGTQFDEELHTDPASPGRSFETPEVLLLRSAQQRCLTEAVERLAVEFREVFVLREMEGLSYKEIAETAHIPIGTVMSRLSRAEAPGYRELKDGEPGSPVRRRPPARRDPETQSRAVSTRPVVLGNACHGRCQSERFLRCWR